MKEKLVATIVVATLGAGSSCAHSPEVKNEPVVTDECAGFEELDSGLVGRTMPSHLVATADPDKALDSQLACVARRVAHCVFEDETSHPDRNIGDDLLFNYKGHVDSAVLEDQSLAPGYDNSTFSVEVHNFVEGTEIQLPLYQPAIGGLGATPVSVDSLHLDIFPEGESGPKIHFRDLGLDGNVDQFNSDVKNLGGPRETFQDNRRLKNPYQKVENPDVAKHAQALYRKALLSVHAWCRDNKGKNTER